VGHAVCDDDDTIRCHAVVRYKFSSVIFYSISFLIQSSNYIESHKLSWWNIFIDYFYLLSSVLYQSCAPRLCSRTWNSKRSRGLVILSVREAVVYMRVASPLLTVQAAPVISSPVSSRHALEVKESTSFHLSPFNNILFSRAWPTIGACRFIDCEKASCSGGSCNFEAPRNTLRNIMLARRSIDHRFLMLYFIRTWVL